MVSVVANGYSFGCGHAYGTGYGTGYGDEQAAVWVRSGVVVSSLFKTCCSTSMVQLASGLGLVAGFKSGFGQGEGQGLGWLGFQFGALTVLMSLSRAM